MSENNEATQAPETVETVEVKERPQEAPEETIAALRKALRDANREAKDNRLARDELDKLKAAQMSDLERVTAERDAIAKERESLRAEAARFRIATQFGITDEDAETFLTGSDEETLTRQAQRLRALASTVSNVPTSPKPDRTQGGSGAPAALNSDALEEALRRSLGMS